jgi:hypothetical protein
MGSRPARTTLGGHNVSRRKSSFKQRCFQALSVGVLLYGTAILLHAVAAWAYGMR